MRLVQLRHSEKGRRIAVVDGDELHLIRDSCRSTYELAAGAIERDVGLRSIASELASDARLDYESVYCERSPWVVLPAFDHPSEPARCLVTGTGLTHRLSAQARQKIHLDGEEDEAELTDSMRIYRWGVQGGRPERGAIGVQPEWFYKGCGSVLRAHNESLEVPRYGDDGGEEAEVAGAYLIAPDGSPRRVGLMQGNEFSDHVMESKNYLYLAPSKLRTCSVGPELVIGTEFRDVRGTVRIERGAKIIWERPVATGEENMCHSLANLEHHHFKYPAHRRAGDAHIHFFGANVVSFGEKLTLEHGDVMIVELEGFGRSLRNPLAVDRGREHPIVVRPLA